MEKWANLFLMTGVWMRKILSERLKAISKANVLNDHGFKLDIAGFSLTGRMADFFEQGLIQIRYAKIKPKHLINTWIYHLVTLCFR